MANFRDVTLDEFDPVFVTADAVHYCNSGLCQDAETVVPHNLDVFADQISLTADGRPQIYVNGFLTGVTTSLPSSTPASTGPVPISRSKPCRSVKAAGKVLS